jgi:hypothetical protein
MFSIRFQNNELSPDRLAPFATETANNYDKIGVTDIENWVLLVKWIHVLY